MQQSIDTDAVDESIRNIFHVNLQNEQTLEQMRMTLSLVKRFLRENLP